MSSKSTGRVPKLRLHKPSGRAVVRLDGKDIYLGEYGSEESRVAYDRTIAEWLLLGQQAPACAGSSLGEITVGGLMIAYLEFARGYYRKNGEQSGEFDSIRYSFRPLRLYESTLVNQFGPLALKVVQQKMVDADLCRKEVNKRLGRIVRMFKWGVGQELVPPMTHHALAQVSGLRRGRTNAKESEPVKPVADSIVDQVKPLVSERTWTMIELQRLTGIRPGEVCRLSLA